MRRSARIHKTVRNGSPVPDCGSGIGCGEFYHHTDVDRVWDKKQRTTPSTRVDIAELKHCQTRSTLDLDSASADARTYDIACTCVSCGGGGGGGYAVIELNESDSAPGTGRFRALIGSIVSPSIRSLEAARVSARACYAYLLGDRLSSLD